MAKFNTIITKKKVGQDPTTEKRAFESVSDCSFCLNNIEDELVKDDFVRVLWAGDEWIKSIGTSASLYTVYNGAPVTINSPFEPGSVTLAQEWLYSVFPIGSEVELQIGNQFDDNFWPLISGEIVHISENRLFYVKVKPFTKENYPVQKNPEKKVYSEMEYIAQCADMSWDSDWCRKHPTFYSTKMCKIDDVGRLMPDVAEAFSAAKITDPRLGQEV